MHAIAKSRPAPGVEIIEVDEPQIKPGYVKVKVERGSVCGTDLHIYNWDAWASHRIKPPRVIGHEFCGTVVEVGDGVEQRKVGDFVASESHIVCGHCRQCLSGQGHVCVNTVLLGVDIDGGFAPYAVIPEANARLTPPNVPRAVASMQDALGNAVHTVMAGPIADRKILITGLGPIGLFAIAICKALGAEKVYATEVSPFRIEMGQKLGADLILDPRRDNPAEVLSRLEPTGVDATLEMSGHPSSIPLALEHTRPGGRISFLGLFPDVIECFDLNKAIFKGIDMQCIIGRRLYETWDQMAWLLSEKGLDVTSVITYEMPYTEVTEAMEIMKAGKAGKIVLNFED